MRVLIVKLSALGDVIHALQAASIIPRSSGNIELWWLTEKKYFPLFKNITWVSKLVPFSRKALFSLRNLKFDVIIDLQGLLKSSFFLPFLKAEIKAGFDSPDLRESVAAVFYNLKVKTKKKHIVEKLRELICFSLGIQDDEKYPPVFKTCGDCEFDVLFLPSAAWETKILTKSWCLEFLSGCLGMGLDVRVLLGKGDYLRLRFPVFSERFYAGLNLEEAFSVIQRARVVVGPDTGFLHAAAAMGKRVIGLYCPSDAERNAPFFEKSEVLLCDCPLKGCFKRSCFKSCTAEIPPELVLSKLA